MRGPIPARSSGGKRKAPAVEAPECPGWLDAEAKAEWGRVSGELVSAGLLARVDRAALAAYCQAWAELVTCSWIVQKEGRVIEEPLQNAKGELLGTRKKAHPALAAQRDAFGRVRAYLSEFGLTPAARARMRFTEDVGQDELTALLNGT